MHSHVLSPLQVVSVTVLPRISGDDAHTDEDEGALGLHRRRGHPPALFVDHRTPDAECADRELLTNQRCSRGGLDIQRRDVRKVEWQGLLQVVREAGRAGQVAVPSWLLTPAENRLGRSDRTHGQWV